MSLNRIYSFWTTGKDKEVVTEADMSISGVYKQIWAICKLKR